MIHQVDWKAIYPDMIFLNGPRNRREVALTFDDGPETNYTPRILSILSRHRVRAAFFCLGQHVAAYPNVLRQIVNQGHIVGNHSWSHADLSKVTVEEVRSEIRQTNQAIRNLTGLTPLYLRPPFGAISDQEVQTVREFGMKIILWDTDSLDWSGITRDEIVQNVVSQVKPGSIILMHNFMGAKGLENTIQALPVIITRLRNMGYRFVSLEELLSIPAYR